MSITALISIASVAIPAFLKVADIVKERQKKNPSPAPAPHPSDTGRPVLDALRRFGRTRQRLQDAAKRNPPSTNPTDYDF